MSFYMRVVYLSRQFNHSGLAVFDALSQSDRFDVMAVVVPPVRDSQHSMRRLNRPLTAWWEKLRYWWDSARTGARRLRFEESILRRARREGIPVLEISSLKEETGWQHLEELKPDLIVLGGGWPELLPPEVIDLAPLGAVNTHPSLLPAYRGTDVHRWQIRDGVRVSGISVHYLDRDFDTGPVLGQVEVEIRPGDTPQDLSRRTSQAAGPLVLSVLDRIARAAPQRVEVSTQPAGGSDLFPRWPWADDEFIAIDPGGSAREVERLVLACSQESFRHDGPWIWIGSRQFVVRTAEIRAPVAEVQPGTLVIRGGWPVLQCGDEAVILRRLQERGPVPMRSRSVSGRRFARNVIGRSNYISLTEGNGR